VAQEHGGWSCVISQQCITRSKSQNGLETVPEKPSVKLLEAKPLAKPKLMTKSVLDFEEW